MSRAAAALLRRRTKEITYLGRRSAWQNGLAIADAIVKSGVQMDKVAHGALICAVANGGNWRIAIALLSELRLRAGVEAQSNAPIHSRHEKYGIVGNLSALDPSPAGVAATIKACGRARRWDIALSILDATRSKDIVMVTASIDACGRGSAWEGSLQLIRKAKRSGLPIDIVAWNATIAACSQGSAWQTSLAALDSTRRHSILPDVMTYCAAMSACERGTRWRTALAIFEDLQCAHLNPGIVGCASAASACEKGSCWEGALAMLSRIFSETGQTNSNLSRKAPAIGAAIAACAAATKWEFSLTLFRWQYVDQATLGATMVSCERAAQWHVAWQLFKECIGGGRGATDNCADVAVDAAVHTSGIRACERASEPSPVNDIFASGQRWLSRAVTKSAATSTLAEQEAFMTAVRARSDCSAMSRTLDQSFARVVTDDIHRRLEGLRQPTAHETLRLAMRAVPRSTRINEPVLSSIGDLGHLYTRDELCALPPRKPLRRNPHFDMEYTALLNRLKAGHDFGLLPRQPATRQVIVSLSCTALHGAERVLSGRWTLPELPYLLIGGK